MENDWDVVRSDRGWSAESSGMGILRITLLFGCAAVALALIIAPIADSQTRSYVAQDGEPMGLDTMTTGSIKGGDYRSRYTIHRSVLQSSPQAVCVIRADGSRIGDC
jgi:hypothetical protein